MGCVYLVFIYRFVFRMSDLSVCACWGREQICGRGLVSGMRKSSGNYDASGSYWRLFFVSGNDEINK